MFKETMFIIGVCVRGCVCMCVLSPFVCVCFSF